MTSLWHAIHQPIETDVPEPGATFDDIVVGGGITGLTTALLLARAGRTVAVLDARSIGAVASGNSSAKVSVLQGSHLQHIQRQTYRSIAQAYVDANLAGQRWLEAFLNTAGVPFDRRTAVSYAATPEGVDRVRREHHLAQSFGLNTQLHPEANLPFPTFAAVSLENQFQCDPVQVINALAVAFRALGGRIYEGVRMRAARASVPVVTRTSVGDFFSETLILATGAATLDRGLYFAKTTANRSYVTSYRVTEPIPTDMFLSVDGPTRSLRTATSPDGELLLVGGNGHPVGRYPSPADRVADLTTWTTAIWPSASQTHAWSAQDYATPHGVPFVGALPRGRGRILLATGFEKWGMTNGVQCAITLASSITGSLPDWASALHHRITLPRALAWGLRANVATGWQYAAGYARGFGKRMPEADPAEGAGIVARTGVRPTARSTVDGKTCSVSGLCPHLGAVLTWNDQESSWDCPAHGSRFAATGEPLEGPATRSLRTRPATGGILS